MTVAKKKIKKTPSPMMLHFLEVKQEYHDSILFYRCGDFYETFYEDAKLAARELDITLTSRDKNSESPVPMAGVPYHAAGQYIARLVEKGYKVAICEQMEDPKQAKGMVKRAVVRVVTPGLVLDSNNLVADENNFLVSVCPAEDNHAGIAVLDISTGEFRCTTLTSDSDLSNELVKLVPREVLLPDFASELDPDQRWMSWNKRPLVNYRHDINYDLKRSEELLIEQFNTNNLEGFGLEGMELAIKAAGALLSYVQETQKQQIDHIRSIKPYFISDYMILDETTKINLELERNLREGKKYGSLLGVLDHCKTPLGSRTLKQWLNYPLLNTTKLKTRLNVVEELFLHEPIREEIRHHLSLIGDLARLASRISLNHTNARDLYSLGESLQSLSDLKEYLKNQTSDLFATFADNIDPLPKLSSEIKLAIKDDPPLTIREGRMFKKGYTKELDELIDLAEHGKDEILNIERREKKATGIPTLKVRYNRVFGYYIELSKLNASKAPAHYVRKQTLTNAERFITDELKKFEDKVLNAEDRRNTLEYSLFEELRKKVMFSTQSLLNTSDTIGSLDSLASLATVAAKNDYKRPEINTSSEIFIEDGRHPVVEAIQKNEAFIPNDTVLDTNKNQLVLITGPNMAGKSTVMRQVALIVLMAQIGSFVPAGKTKIGVVDRIFTRVGAADNLVRGLSTFMVEMTETANILNNATKHSLIILDEIGRGTSTFDGLSIAWAVAEYIHDNIRAKTMFATHYHELTEMSISKERVSNMNIAVKEYNEEIIFLRKLVKGATNRSYGIQVGRLAGLPNDVIKRAGEVLKNLESGQSNESGLPTFASFGSRNSNPDQLSLFSTPVKIDKTDNVILEYLSAISPETLSPIEALNLLFKWKNLQRK